MIEKLNPGNYYHIYNRGNNRENIFYQDKNYKYFLNKFEGYLTKFTDLYAFCLLPNHFHFLVRVKGKEVITLSDGIDKPGTQKQNDSITQSDGIDMQVSERFRRFFLGYSQAINKQENRTGSLFEKNFKRKLIDKEDYLNRIIYYIHLNPVLHKISSSFEDYQYSSYRIILSNKPTKLRREKVLELFTNKDEFIKFHKKRLEEKSKFDEYFLE